MSDRAEVPLELLAPEFVVYKSLAGAPLPSLEDCAGVFCSLTVTDQEISVVCASGLEPANVQVDGGWRALYARGPIPFELTGVVASMTAAIARGGLPVFVVSTFDGDVVMVRSKTLDLAINLLGEAGHPVRVN